VTIYRIKYPSTNVNESEKLILDSHPDQHENLTISAGSRIAPTCHVWSTFVNAFVSYPAHRQNERQNAMITVITQLRQPWRSNNT